MARRARERAEREARRLRNGSLDVAAPVVRAPPADVALGRRTDHTAARPDTLAADGLIPPRTGVVLDPAAVAAIPDGDVRGRAWLLLSTLAGGGARVVSDRVAEIERRAALDVLDLTNLEFMSAKQLSVHAKSVLEELRRRGMSAPAPQLAPTGSRP